jgi:hypothetical protein
VCDPQEVCDGVNNDCPTDSKDSTTVCRVSGGVCDPQEVCDGVNNDCPTDSKDSTTVCRSSAGVCDPQEVCDGVNNNCPTDSKDSTTVCRSSAGVCDPREVCDGVGNDCPADLLDSTTVCREASGICDVAEICNGTDPTCPADGFAGAETVCRAGAGACDPEETCSGTASECPAEAPPPSSCNAEGCSPGFWKNHTNLWDGLDGDDVTSSIRTSTTWASLNIPSCDGKNLTGPRENIGQTIEAPNKHSTNTLFHLSACLVSSDALDGFPYNDVNALVQMIKDACAAGGQQLTDLKNDCAAANNHDEITIFCPLD